LRWVKRSHRAAELGLLSETRKVLLVRRNCAVNEIGLVRCGACRSVHGDLCGQLQP